jgi:hypothetical protein
VTGREPAVTDLPNLHEVLLDARQDLCARLVAQ